MIRSLIESRIQVGVFIARIRFSKGSSTMPMNNRRLERNIRCITLNNQRRKVEKGRGKLDFLRVILRQLFAYLFNLFVVLTYTCLASQLWESHIDLLLAVAIFRASAYWQT